MSKAAKSIFVWAIYLFVMGALLFAIPNALLSCFRLSASNGPWIHVVGVLTICLGYLYLRAALAESREYFRWTVHTRIAINPLFIILVLMGVAPTVFLIFGLVDLLGAFWTWRSLGVD